MTSEFRIGQVFRDMYLMQSLRQTEDLLGNPTHGFQFYALRSLVQGPVVSILPIEVKIARRPGEKKVVPILDAPCHQKSNEMFMEDTTEAL